MAMQITDNNFDELVTQSGKPAMIDFWAEWCGPCRQLAPTVDDISKEFEGRALIGKVDVDSNPNIAARFAIRNIPTVLFIKDGKVADKQVGVAPKQVLVNKLLSLL